MIAVLGKNRIAIEALRILDSFEIPKDEILICINSTDKGVHSWQPSLKAYCENLDYRIVNLQELCSIKNLIIISLEYDRLLKPNNFATSEIYNIHFSNLPKYKGMFTSIHPILNYEEIAGVTLHRIDPGIDTGEIIDQLLFPLDSKWNGRQLYESYTENAIHLLNKCLRDIIGKNLKSVPQSARHATYFSKTSINFTSLNIDFSDTANSINSFIRAFTFRPYQLLSFNGKNVSHSKILNAPSVNSRPGKIVEENDDSVIVTTIDYNIEIFYDKLDVILELSRINNAIELKVLVENGYWLDDSNHMGWTPLIVACYNGSIDVVKLLLEHKVEVNRPNNNGTNPLMYAMVSSSSRNYEICELLLKHGANPSLVDYKNKSVFDYANEYNKLGLMRLFKKHV